MASSKRVMVKLMVDKEKNRVVFAESNHEFVDILFSFLTMPLGTVIRVLGKKASSLGSLANIYDSVASLAPQYLQTEACKAMLLRPRNAAEVKCEDLAINIDDTESRTFYTCGDCSLKKYLYSSVSDARCICGKLMSRVTRWERTDKKANGDGVFVKGGFIFIISDDLNVTLASTAVLMSQVKILSIEDGSMLEERFLDFGSEEIASLLWRSLISETPLTDLYFSKSDMEDAAIVRNKKDAIQQKLESDVDCKPKDMQLKLVLSKSDNKMLYAEVEEDMVDLLFSFLTFPVGFLIKNTEYLSKGCIVNLYKSVEKNNYMKTEDCKSMLLSPNLGSFHGCSSSQLLKTQEMASNTRTVPGCYTTVYDRFLGSHYVEMHVFKEMNPKSPNNGTEPGGGYVKGLGKFIVTDDIRIAPLSLITSVQMLNEFKIPFRGLLEREASMTLSQALNLLRAAVCSCTALTDVFVPEKKQRRPSCLV